jgi:hypothetical protein
VRKIPFDRIEAFLKQNLAAGGRGMNRKKKIAAILLTATLGLALSACGGASRGSASV